MTIKVVPTDSGQWLVLDTTTHTVIGRHEQLSKAMKHRRGARAQLRRDRRARQARTRNQS